MESNSDRKSNAIPHSLMGMNLRSTVSERKQSQIRKVTESTVSRQLPEGGAKGSSPPSHPFFARGPGSGWGSPVLPGGLALGLLGSLETPDAPGGVRVGGCTGCSGRGGSAPHRVVLAICSQLVWCMVMACACCFWVLPGAVAAASVSPGLGYRGGDLRQWCRNTASSDAGVRFADARGPALQTC